MRKSFKFEVCRRLSSCPGGGADGAGRRLDAGCAVSHAPSDTVRAITATTLNQRATTPYNAEAREYRPTVILQAKEADWSDAECCAPNTGVG